MNKIETMELLKTVRAYNPSFTYGKETPPVWASALADMPVEAATEAVHEHFLVAGPWIAVADIRRRVAERMGLLPPDAETAYAQAVAFRRWLNLRVDPEPQIHPAAIEAARTIGWQVFDAPEGVAHARFAAAYVTARERALLELARTPYATLAARIAEPRALPGGYGIQPPPTGPVNHAGLARLDAMVNGLANRMDLDRAAGE